MKLSVILALSCAAAAARSVPVRRADFSLQNGQQAVSLNQQFASLTPNSSCQADETACVQNQKARCRKGQFRLHPCSSDLICAALPKDGSEQGVNIECTTAAERDAKIAATGATANATSSTASPSLPISAPTPSQPAGNNTNSTSLPASSANTTDPQSSLTLLQSVIATGFANDGQDQPEAGQVPSLTSSNNFINFCATAPGLPLTNGQQLANGSCNPAPMGIIAAATNMPAAKFQSPANGAVLAANTTFAVQLAVSHLATGHFVNADQNYFAAPQQVDAAGDIVGHSHIVIEQLTALNQTEPTDPSKFVFFKGLNSVAENGVLTANVTNGLGPGFYRIATINSAANHQPVLVAIAQHGSLDDMVYFTVQ